MATTASGIRYPLSSDTVNIATDIQNTASDIDTKIAAQTFTLTTVGDIATHNGTAHTRLEHPKKSGLILTASSTETNGINWTGSHLPNMYFIASGSSVAATAPITFSNIPQSFSAIRFYMYLAGATSRVMMLSTINGFTESGSNWMSYGYLLNNAASDSSFTTATNTSGSTSPLPIGYNSRDNNKLGWAEFTIHDYANVSARSKPFTIKYCASNTTTGRPWMGIGFGNIVIDPTNGLKDTIISSIGFELNGSSSTQYRNDIYLYGIK